jgi:hypothetical protein
MDISRYIDDVQRQLEVAAGAGGDEAQALAQRLTAPLESTVRLVLIEALSAAANEITLELAPTSVEVRLRGRDPEFVVSTPPASPVFEQMAATSSAPLSPADGDDGTVARTTFRLSEQLKQRMEDAATSQGLSVNAWLVRAVTQALQIPDGDRTTRRGKSEQSYTGWAQ